MIESHIEGKVLESMFVLSSCLRQQGEDVQITVELCRAREPNMTYSATKSPSPEKRPAPMHSGPGTSTIVPCLSRNSMRT